MFYRASGKQKFKYSKRARRDVTRHSAKWQRTAHCPTDYLEMVSIYGHYGWAATKALGANPCMWAVWFGSIPVTTHRAHIQMPHQVTFQCLPWLILCIRVLDIGNEAQLTDEGSWGFPPGKGWKVDLRRRASHPCSAQWDILCSLTERLLSISLNQLIRCTFSHTPVL